MYRYFVKPEIDNIKSHDGDKKKYPTDIFTERTVLERTGYPHQ